MASVSSSDNNNSLINYYKQVINDMDDQRHDENKRLRQENSEEIDRIQKSYQKEINEREDHTSRLFSEQNQAHDAAFTREKESNTAEIERLRSMYNRKGESTVPYQQYKTEVDQFNRAIPQMKREYEQGLESKDKEVDRTKTLLNEARLKHEEALNQQLEQNRKSQGEALERVQDKYQQDLENLKSTYNKRGEYGIAPDVHNREIEMLMDQMKKRHELDAQTMDAVKEENNSKLNEQEIKYGDRIANLRKQQVTETKNLNDQIRDLSNYGMVLDKQKAEYISRSLRDADILHQQEIRRLSDSHDKALSDLKHDLDNTDDYYARLTQEILHTKEKQNAEIIKQNNEQNYQNQKELQNTFRDQTDRLEAQRKDQERQYNTNMEKAMNEANQKREDMLLEKSKQYSEETDRNNKVTDEKISQLEHALQVQRTTSDTSVLSPAAEEAFRKTYEHEYGKALKTEVEKNKVEFDNLSDKYARQYQQSLQEIQDRATQSIGDNQRDRAIERSQLVGTIDDTVYRTNTQLKEQNADHERERQNLYKQFGAVMARQKIEYDHIFQAMREDADLKLNEVREENATVLRNSQREAKDRHSNTVREYENKLSAQKEEYEAIIENLKAQNQIDLRNKDKGIKNDLDAQARSYEQRLAQQEALSKERERNISQTYQDELDRTRRSYEILAQKKG